MDMTEFEIVKDYGESKNKKEQIAILADRNLCSTADIMDILKKNGIPLPKGVKKKQYRKSAAGRVQWTEENLAKLQAYVLEGKTLPEIADLFGTGPSAVSKQVVKHHMRERAKMTDGQTEMKDIDEAYISQLECQLKDAEKEKKSMLAAHKKEVAAYTETVVQLEEALEAEKRKCKQMEGERTEYFENGPFLEILRQAESIKGLAVLALCAVGKFDVDRGMRAALINIADSADIILEEAGEKKAPDGETPGEAV